MNPLTKLRIPLPFHLVTHATVLFMFHLNKEYSYSIYLHEIQSAYKVIFVRIQFVILFLVFNRKPDI